MLTRRPLRITVIAAVAVGLSSCGSGSVTTATTPSQSSTTSTTSTTSASTPTTTSGASPTTTESGPRTVVELKSALLELTDLPSGFAIEPAGGEDGDVPVASTDLKCAALVKLINAKSAPGSKASANVSFSGGQAGPSVDESIDAMGSADAVEALQASFKSAVAACRQLAITIPGQGSSTMKVTEVSAPKFGDHPFAARMTGTSGPMDGLEITQVTAGVKDAIVSITFVAASPGDVDDATEAALGKAGEVLGRAKAGA
jgi:hypothetical protein